MELSADTYRWTYQTVSLLSLELKWNESRFQILPGVWRLHLPIMLSAYTSDKRLKGNFLGSDINSDSRVPLIQTHIACELGLINLKIGQQHMKGDVVRRLQHIKWESLRCGLINQTTQTPHRGTSLSQQAAHFISCYVWKQGGPGRELSLYSFLTWEDKP